jgi:reactive chlorine resistance protein C
MLEKHFQRPAATRERKSIRNELLESNGSCKMRTPDHILKTLFSYADRLAGPLMRVSLGVTLLWIGCIDLLDPRGIVSLLSQSLPFLAFTQFVYALKILEITAGSLLIAGLWVRYVALSTLALFAGTLTIFVIAPGVTGFPMLTDMGQFLLKDTVLASAAIALVARDAASHEAKLPQPGQGQSLSEGIDIRRPAA